MSYTDTDGLVVNKRELELRHCREETNPDVIGIVETKHNEDIDSHLLYPTGCGAAARQCLCMGDVVSWETEIRVWSNGTRCVVKSRQMGNSSERRREWNREDRLVVQ